MDQAITRAAGATLSATQPAAAAPRTWMLCLTSANHGVVGPLGATFKHAGEKHERVLVVEVPAAAGAPSDQVNLKLVTGAGAARPVGEFQGYVDGEPFVAWADRTRMPQVGDKLYAGAAPIAAQAGQVAVPEGWTLVRGGEDIQLRRADGKWCGYSPEIDSPAHRLTHEFLSAMLAAPSPAKESK